MDSVAANVKAIFGKALAAATPAERSAYLNEACGGDVDLRFQVEALLAALDQASELHARSQTPPTLETSDYHPTGERTDSVIGPYRLLEQIGEGGFGLVYVAEQQVPVRRKVALKLLKPGMDSRLVIARFEAERQALALMDHANIARILDAGTTPTGRPYFVMELVKGVPITDYCDRNQLNPRERLELFAAVCHAVQHAHQKGIIHRDIKPSNVLVCLHEGKPVPKIIDFGIVKAIGPRLTEQTIHTQVAELIGTPLYMSPEQAEMTGLDIDTRSDIYSLGVLLYELLTGMTPFDRRRLAGVTFDEMRRIIREEEPPRPSTRLRQSTATLATIATQRKMEPVKLTRLLRGELDWIVMKCLEKDRTRRYETANGLARDIEHYLHDEPVEACPPSAGYRLRKLARKYKKGLTVAVLVAGLLLAGAAVSAWQAVRATLAEHQANDQRDRALKAEASAENSEAEARAVLTFFQDKVLSAGRPEGEEGGLGKDVKLRQALDAAEPKIAAAFRDQPLVEASIRNVLGITYRYLGEIELSIKQHERAMQLHTATVGPEDPRTLVSMTNLAMAYSEDGRYKEALPLFEHVLKVRKEKLGPEHPLTLRSMHSLGVAYCDQNRNAEAVPFFEEAYRKQKAIQGPKHLDTLDSMHSLAIAYKDVGRFDEALALYKETLKLHEETLGADNPATLLVLNNLASAYGDAGRLAEALPLFEQVLNRRTDKLGADHPRTLTTLFNVALNYFLLGRLSEALPRFEQTLNQRKAKLAPNHPDIFYAALYVAQTYQELGQYDRAAKLLTGLPEQIKDRLGADHPFRPFALACWGRNLLLQQHAEAAEKPLRQSLDLYAAHAEDNEVEIAFGRSLLGAALQEQKKYTEAEPLLRQGSEGLLADAKKRPQVYAPGTPGRRHLNDALDHLVKLYETTGKSDEANHWRKELAVWTK